MTVTPRRAAAPGSYRLDQIYMGSSGRELPLIIGLHPLGLTVAVRMDSYRHGVAAVTGRPMSGDGQPTDGLGWHQLF